MNGRRRKVNAGLCLGSLAGRRCDTGFAHRRGEGFGIAGRNGESKMANPNLERFLGGSPIGVLIRLVVVSFLVGLLLLMFGVEPWDIVASLQRLAQRIIDDGLADFRQVGRTLLTGAIIVVPIWLVIRLLDARKSR
jgi:hypothetical protein